MEIYLFLAFGAFLAGNFGSRYIIQNAFAELPDDEKLIITNLNNNKRSSKRGIVVMVITLVYLAVIFFKLLPVKPVFYVFMATAIAYLVFAHFQTVNSLQANNIQPTYISKTKVSSIVRIAGILVFALFLAVGL